MFDVDFLQGLFTISDFVAKFSTSILALSFTYQILLILLGLKPLRGSQRISCDTRLTPLSRFAIVISARNEEAVIAGLLESLLAQNYPRERFDVFVIADNCTDQTAAVARSKGAIVYERYDDTKCTKGFALEWFFNRFLRKYGKSYDACIIFDADNLVDPDFLAVMDRQRQNGRRLAVGYRDSKNPSSSSISSCNSIFWLYQTRFLHQGRSRIGLPLTSLSGTGFMFDLSLIRESGWHTSTLTEDTEFTIQMILRGEQPVLVREARFYDEQTSDWPSMLRQRWRWSVGTTQTLRLMLPSLLSGVAKGQWKWLDTIWFLLQIPVFALVTLLGLLRFSINLPYFDANLLSLAAKLAPSLLAYLVMLLLVCLLLKLEGKSLKRYRKGIFTYPIVAMVWGVLQLSALFTRTTVWKPIKHYKTSLE